VARIARWILRYHGCTQELANELITGTRPISAWPQSKHPYDWLGLGIYFWEHGPERAMRWAQDKHRASAATVGATIQLDHCFDLLDVGFTGELLPAYQLEQQEAETIGRSLPLNRGRDADLGGRYLDCLVINRCLRASPEFQAVRGAFQEGEIEGLRRALNAMQGWSAARRLQYQVTLGVKNRKAEYTQDFGGEAMPEPDNIAMIVVPASGSLPLIKLLYVLRQCDDLCLNAPTARSIIRAQSMIESLYRAAAPRHQGCRRRRARAAHGPGRTRPGGSRS